MAAVDALLDAGPLVGFLDGSDQWHEFARSAFEKIRFPAFTCEAVLSEAAYLLRHLSAGRAALYEMVDTGAVLVLPVFPEGRAYVRQAAARYGVRADLADLGLLWLAEIYPAAVILTTDKRDFSRYRLENRRAVRVLSP